MRGKRQKKLPTCLNGRRDRAQARRAFEERYFLNSGDRSRDSSHTSGMCAQHFWSLQNNKELGNNRRSSPLSSASRLLRSWRDLLDSINRLIQRSSSTANVSEWVSLEIKMVSADKRNFITYVVPRKKNVNMFMKLTGSVFDRGSDMSATVGTLYSHFVRSIVQRNEGTSRTLTVRRSLTGWSLVLICNERTALSQRSWLDRRCSNLNEYACSLLCASRNFPAQSRTCNNADLSHSSLTSRQVKQTFVRISKALHEHETWPKISAVKYVDTEPSPTPLRSARTELSI